MTIASLTRRLPLTLQYNTASLFLSASLNSLNQLHSYAASHWSIYHILVSIYQSTVFRWRSSNSNMTASDPAKLSLHCTADNDDYSHRTALTRRVQSKRSEVSIACITCKWRLRLHLGCMWMGYHVNVGGGIIIIILDTLFVLILCCATSLRSVCLC
jgi:hypothetical protein